MRYEPFCMEYHTFPPVLKRLPQQFCRRGPHLALSNLELIHLYRTKTLRGWNLDEWCGRDCGQIRKTNTCFVSAAAERMQQGPEQVQRFN